MRELVRTVKAKTFDILEMRESGALGKWVGTAIMLLILASVLATVFETIPALESHYQTTFEIIDVLVVAIFSVEYVLRLWLCTSDEQFKGFIRGRIKYALTPMAIVDILAIAPFYLPMLLHVNLRFLRILRLMRIFRLFKIDRFYDAIKTMANVFRNKWPEVSTCLIVLALILIISASVMYEIEHEAQPNQFSSIPATMWWSIATLATIGYGDIYPITSAGKIVAAVLAVTGIGIFALLPGILATGFMEELQKKSKPSSCPHCGKSISSQGNAS